MLSQMFFQNIARSVLGFHVDAADILAKHADADQLNAAQEERDADEGRVAVDSIAANELL